MLGSVTWTRGRLLVVVATLAVSGFLIGFQSTSLLHYSSIRPSLPPRPLGPLSNLGFQADRAYRRIEPDGVRSYRSDLVDFVRQRLSEPEASRTLDRLNQFLDHRTDCRHPWCALSSWIKGSRTLPAIPATIFQTSPDGSWTPRVESWQTQNPDWRLQVFDDRAINETLGRVDAPWGELLNGTAKESGVMRADVWRYLILMLEGEQEFGNK
jgi:hypothetical protein